MRQADPGAASGTNTRRAVVLVAWALISLCVSALIRDAFRLPDTYAFPRPGRITTISEAAARVGRARALNAVVCDAARDAGDGTVERLIVPENVRELLDVEADVFAGREQATLDPRLMRPFLGGNPSIATYEAVLSSGEEQDLLRTGVTEYPLDVRAVIPAEGEPSRFVLFADPSRTTLYLVPDALAPRGVPEEAVSE